MMIDSPRTMSTCSAERSRPTPACSLWAEEEEERQAVAVARVQREQPVLLQEQPVLLQEQPHR